MHILLSSIRHLAALQETTQEKSADPIAFLSLDSSNAFNCLTRKQLSAVLLKGCEVRLRSAFASPAQPGRKLLNLNLTDGTCCGNSSLPTTAAAAFSIFFTGSGTATDINSESGVQQSDALGSTLFALAIHPVLLDLSRLYPLSSVPPMLTMSFSQGLSPCFAHWQPMACTASKCRQSACVSTAIQQYLFPNGKRKLMNT